MKYLTIQYIKAHSRIDYDCEDDLLDVYGMAAEEAVLNLLNCSLDDLKQANGGNVPQGVINATFELADNLIRHRSPTEQTKIIVVPHNFDLLLKSHMVL